MHTKLNKLNSIDEGGTHIQNDWPILSGEDITKSVTLCLVAKKTTMYEKVY